MTSILIHFLYKAIHRSISTLRNNLEVTNSNGLVVVPQKYDCSQELLGANRISQTKNYIRIYKKLIQLQSLILDMPLCALFSSYSSFASE
ncbi:unnamed protein product [Allacma fusca]|uniref:Uncharacterized protein n=1 Tax=Allacma fusca TaxID=39272 RepID=A0A8J2KNY2_9HEXA|nr:unnamed protein product [Allacma fusca]